MQLRRSSTRGPTRGLTGRVRRALSRLVISCATLGLACVAAGEGESSDSESESGEPHRCGPTVGVVERVVDGDTIVLESGERIRYLLIDTPEISPPAECWGQEATDTNVALVEGKTIQLDYDVQCNDIYNRLLAYVYVDGVEVNTRLVERGHACVLHIEPNGDDRVNEFLTLENAAREAGLGMWSACGSPCN